jgi:Ulp1 family protease
MAFLKAGYDYDYKCVFNWTKKLSVFNMRRIYCPINISNTHWTLAIVHMDIREIRYNDSMNGNGKMYMAASNYSIRDIDIPTTTQISRFFINWKLSSTPNPYLYSTYQFVTPKFSYTFCYT